YWPGRKAISAPSSRSTTSSMLSSESCSTAATVPSTLPTSVLHRLEATGTWMTQSEEGTIWQVSTMPSAASSSESASSMYSSPMSNSPCSQCPLQVPQTPSEQSIGRLTFWR